MARLLDERTLEEIVQGNRDTIVEAQHSFQSNVAAYDTMTTLALEILNELREIKARLPDA